MRHILAHTKSVKRVFWNVNPEKLALVMATAGLDCHSTKVKGHNDVDIPSHALLVFFPGRLQNDLFSCHCALLRMRK